MKATSARLEVFVKLSSEELIRLKKASLTGELKFYDDPSPPRFIPMEIIYDSEQRGLLKVNSIPDKVYFSKAKRIIFRINNEYYNFVNNNGIFSDRFFTGGKLTMAIEGRYTPY